jgi:G3E family GTPase
MLGKVWLEIDPQWGLHTHAFNRKRWSPWTGARTHADRCQQRPCTDDIHDARQVVGEHAERHLARDFRRRLHQEVSRAHPHLERTEGMLNCFAPAAHGLGILIQSLLHGFEHVLGPVV